jgi:hypothetical protein
MIITFSIFSVLEGPEVDFSHIFLNNTGRGFISPTLNPHTEGDFDF